MDDSELYNDDAEAKNLILIERFLSSGQYGRALEIVEIELSKNSEEIQLLLQAACCHCNLGELKTAIKQLKSALTQDPDSGYAHYLLSICYDGLPFKTSLALDHIHRAIEIDPNDADYWCHLASIHHDCNDYSEAIKYAEKSLQIDSDHFQSKLLLAAVRSDFLNPDVCSEEEQIEIYLGLLREYPECAEVHLELGTIYGEKLNNYDQAIHHYEIVLRTDPSSEVAQKLLVKAVNKKSLLIRVLHSPVTFVNKLPNLLAFVIVRIFVKIVHSVTLAPLEIAYKYLTLADTRKKLGQLHIYSGITARLHRSPFALRFGLFLVLWLSLITFWCFAAIYDGLARAIVFKIFSLSLYLCLILIVIILALCLILKFQKWRRLNKNYATEK